MESGSLNPITFDRFDFVLVGGGLQNALLFLLLRSFQPNATIAMLEAGATVGGNHTWSFHDFDVPEAAGPVVESLVAHRWPTYDVHFPKHSRTVTSPYAAITSERLAARVLEFFQDAPRCRLLLNTEVVAVSNGEVRTRAGATFRGRVIEARGPQSVEPSSHAAYQKFLGLELELGAPAPAPVPQLMDARVRQYDGFRFVYVLPFTPSRVLVEDTYYSDTPALDAGLLRERVLDYAKQQGYQVRGIGREESGVLPLPLKQRPERDEEPNLTAGYGGGWFHPTTGYSLPAALRLALCVARHCRVRDGEEPAEASARFSTELRKLSHRHRRQQRYCLRLNRLLFGAFAPGDRRNVLERFYALPKATIARFYALEMTNWDKARILCGRPPSGISLTRAFFGEALNE